MVNSRAKVLGIAVFCITVILLMGVLGGPSNAIDDAIVRSLAEWRAANPGMEELAASITHVGGGAVLLTASGLASIGLLVRKRYRDTILLLLATAGGRLMIELIKLIVERPRPSFEEHPVYTTNHAFPSGHAGNTTMTFLAMAWFCSPPEYRRTNLVIGAVGAVLVGLTRPVLGVHWPSDILAGWALGVAWVAILVRFSERGAAPA